MKLLEKVVSDDKATKFMVELDDGCVAEATYIEYPNKDIVCVPTQTACRMGCAFCHLTTSPEKLKLRNLYAQEMSGLVKLATEGVEYRRPLLVSFMGAGEPLCNWYNVFDAMLRLRSALGEENVRFALATMLPNKGARVFLELLLAVQAQQMNLKVHLSLHFTSDEERRKWMPTATDIKTSLSLLETYRRATGNDVEVHYTLISGVNDAWINAVSLANLLHGRDIPVKVLHYSENASVDAKPSRFVNLFLSDLKQNGVTAEYYKPNGLSIGSSCGQFCVDNYKKDANV